MGPMSRAEPFRREHLDGLRMLVRAQPLLAYEHHTGLLGTVGVQELAVEQAEAALRVTEGGAFVLCDGARIRGFATWRHLAWDSAILGVSAARIEHLVATGDYASQLAAQSALLDAVESDAARIGVRHLTCRVKAEAIPCIHALQQAGFLLMDGVVTFALDLAEWKDPGPDSRTRPAAAEDCAAVGTIARSSYIHDRFHADPQLEAVAADEIYACWAEQTCRRGGDGEQTGAVVVQDGDSLLGFATWQLDAAVMKHTGVRVGSIGLVGTAPEARGRGIGSAVVTGAVRALRDRDARLVEVGTQLANVAAARLYESRGFRVVSASMTLRRWLGTEERVRA
jgi:dTDP-4-amino-4,6-dideoxy-D-galactose acyltransferase